MSKIFKSASVLKTRESSFKSASYLASRGESQSVTSNIFTNLIPSADPSNSRGRVISTEPEIKRNPSEIARLKLQAENEERRNRRMEMTELQELWEREMQMLNDHLQAKILQAKWDRYMRCDGSPDPVNQKEINTYISLRMEDRSRNDADSVLKDSLLDLELIQELQFMLLDSPIDFLTEEERTAYQKTARDLESLISTKLDLATLQVMCDATYLANKETGNLHFSETLIDDIVLCVWGNIMNNPRIRSYEFTEINFMFEIPRVLALTDCAVRVLVTKFDPFSYTSHTSLPRLHKFEAVIEEVLVAKIEEEQQAEEEDVERKGSADEDAEDKDLKNNLLGVLLSQNQEESMPQPEEETEEIEEDYPDPPTHGLDLWEELNETEDVIDLRMYAYLGRIYHFDLLHLPNQPHFVGAWTITELVDPPDISFMEYAAEVEGAGGKDSKRDEKPAISVSMVIPDDVLVVEQPLTAFWDKDRKVWTTDGFFDVAFTEETRTLAFKVAHYGIMTMFQDMNVHLPFNSWEIRPLGPNNALFTLASSFIEISIEIKEDQCCLKGPKNRPELTTIRNKWLTPADLIQKLQKMGVNFFPNKEACRFLSISEKDQLIEERLYQQMALTVSAVAYSWSKWNLKVSCSAEVIIQAAEAPDFEPINEETWVVIMATKKRVIKLLDLETEEHLDSLRERPLSEEPEIEVRQFSSVMGISSRMNRTPAVSHRSGKPSTIRRMKLKEEFKTPREQFLESFDIDKSVFRSNLYHLLPIIAGDNAMSRINTASFLFINSVHTLLQASRILTYS